VWQADVYYLVRESLPGSDAYHAVIEEVRLSGDGENVSLHIFLFRGHKRVVD
jgi:hypothetical protein